MASPKFTPVPRSDNLKEVGRCDDGHLYVRFHNGGLYRWDNMANQHHDPLLNSQSPGRYVHQMGVKGVKVPE